VTQKVALFEGRPDCQHKFTRMNKDWEEVVVNTDDPTKRKLNTWHHYAVIDKCELCGREELCGGMILVPEGGDFYGGEYALEPDGSRGCGLAN